MTKPIVVQKYGGSSLADVAKLGRVADRVVATRRAGHDVVVVVSAMGKTTDGLLKLADEVCNAGRTPGDEPRHSPRRELDMLVSTGERVSMALLSIAIQARGLDAISFTGSQCGIITNDRHFDARIIEVRPHRIEDELHRGKVVIVAGYQGMSYKREITTLGRGGSDTTAVALAAALEADRCEIYSDVDGVYSADPRAVPEAQHLPEMDYGMLQQLAESGAKVVCAQAVEWARRANIALYARSTFDELSGVPARHTLIRKLGSSERPRARAVAADDKVVLARLSDPAELSALLDALAAEELTAIDLSVGAQEVNAVLSVRNAPDWERSKRALSGAVHTLELREEVGLVSVVGSGLADDPTLLEQLRQVLAKLGQRPAVMLQTALRMAAVIDKSVLSDAQRELHACFVAR